MTIEDQQLHDASRSLAIDQEPWESATEGTDLAPSHRRRELLLAGGAYLVLSIFVWWNVWTVNPRSVTTCGCGDSAGAIAAMEWPAYALTHGSNLLYTTLINHPTGVNLVSSPGGLGLSLPLVPVTWLFGPVASLNVVLTLAPALSALATFVLLRRWVSWSPAAFLGGLFYGFCPFILVSLTLGWTSLAVAAIPPLIVLCLDELLLRQKRRPAVVGVVLGLLVALQFFVSTEVLVMTAIVAICGTALIIAYTALQFPRSLQRNTRAALVGLGTAVVTAVCLLAYPVWFALAGPAHFNGLMWPNGIPSYETNQVQYFVRPPPIYLNSFREFYWHQVGGYQGTFLSFQYFGAGVIIVLLLGLVVWRRDRRLWFFAAITVLSGALSLVHYDSLVFIENLIPGRLVVITYLSVAILLSLIVDHTYRSARGILEAHRGGLKVAAGSRRSIPPRIGGAMVAAIVAAIAIVPPATYLASTLPITTQTVALPTWFRVVAPHLQGEQVLLVYPTFFSDGDESPLSWQAVNDMHYSMVNAAASEGTVIRAGKERPGASVIAKTAGGITAKNLQSQGILAVRKALDAWGVTMIVIPDESNLPPYDRTQSVVAAAAIMTAATGERPNHQANAWIWSAGRYAPSAALVTGTQVQRCTSRVATQEVLTVAAATACVLRSASTE